MVSLRPDYGAFPVTQVSCEAFVPMMNTNQSSPDYFCEVTLWWAFYLFSVSATGELINWSILGTAFLSCMFLLPRGSLDVTEALSSRKYKQYGVYQQSVSRFVPWSLLDQFGFALAGGLLLAGLVCKGK